MNTNFQLGANLALQAFGIRNEMEKQGWMEKLYQSQLLSGESQRALSAFQLEKGREEMERQRGYEREISTAITPPGYEPPGVSPTQLMGPRWIAQQALEPTMKYYPKTGIELATQLMGKEKTYQPQLFMQEGKPIWVAPGEPIPTGALPHEKEIQGTTLNKLLNEYNALSPTDPNRQIYLGAIKKQAESTGIQVRINKDGTIEVIQGPMSPEALTKQMETKVQEKIFNAQEQIARIERTEKMFKPEYQEFITRGKMWWSGIKSKLGADLSPREKSSLTNFAAYKRTAIENINLYIKEITGAQMSEAEANRIRLAMPDPGEGIFGGDDPISFKAKMDDVIRQVKLGVKRYESLLNKGLTSEQIEAMAIGDILPPLEEFDTGYIKEEKAPSPGEIILKDGTKIKVVD